MNTLTTIKTTVVSIFHKTVFTALVVALTFIYLDKNDGEVSFLPTSCDSISCRASEGFSWTADKASTGFEWTTTKASSGFDWTADKASSGVNWVQALWTDEEVVTEE